MSLLLTKRMTKIANKFSRLTYEERVLLLDEMHNTHKILLEKEETKKREEELASFLVTPPPTEDENAGASKKKSGFPDFVKFSEQIKNLLKKHFQNAPEELKLIAKGNKNVASILYAFRPHEFTQQDLLAAFYTWRNFPCDPVASKREYKKILHKKFRELLEASPDDMIIPCNRTFPSGATAVCVILEGGNEFFQDIDGELIE